MKGDDIYISLEFEPSVDYSGAPAARRAAQQSPIGITGKKRKPMKDFPYGYHG